MSAVRERVLRSLPAVFVGVLPATLLSLGVAQFILNHFFVHAPYLLDSGWYSAIVYRAGVLPLNPQMACNYAEWYYGVHFSPLVSMFSVLSYAVPLPRIEWYAVVEAIVYLPIGVATYAVASRVQPERAIYRLPITMAAALAFSFSGQVVAMVGYPHYEAAIPGLICLLLGAVVTGRTRLAWVFLLLAASVREDGGFHAALALCPLLYLNLRGVEPSASRRVLVKLIAVAIGASLVAIACQRLFFHSANLLRHEYLGTPLYGHLSIDLLGARAQRLLEICQFIYYPFVATCLLALLRRDARYLLGWAAAAPWFLINFLAVQDLKSYFAAYTGFPFVVSMFWVYVYGGLIAPTPRRLPAGALEAVFALICASSAIGLQRPAPHWTEIVTEMRLFHRRDRATVHDLVDVLRTRRGDFGRLYVDNAVAAIAIEALGPENDWNLRTATDADSIIFNGRSAVRHDIHAYAEAHGLDVCTHILGTRFYIYSRAPFSATTLGTLATTTSSRPSPCR